MSINLAKTSPQRQAWIDWVKLATGLTTIWDRPNELKPEPPVAVLKVIAGPTKVGGRDDMVFRSGTVFEIKGPRTVNINVQVHGNDAVDTLYKAQRALEIPSVQADLRAAGIAIWLEGGVTDISLLLESGFEERASMDVTFGLRSSVDDDIGIIEKVTIEEEEYSRVVGDPDPIVEGPTLINQ